MKTSSVIYSSEFIETAVLSEREALRRMIQYAWLEAEREGVEECAELLSAALLALEHAGTAASQKANHNATN